MERERTYVAEGRIYAVDEHGIKHLVATPGSIMTESQARAYGLLADDGTIVGTGRTAEADRARVSGTHIAVPPKGSTPTADNQDPDAPDPEFPVHKGGPNWTLSDGSAFKGNREAAEAAEAALHGDPDPENGEDPEDDEDPEGSGDD